VERDLGAGLPALAERVGGRIRITVRHRRGTRTAWLTDAEFRILCSSPAVRAALAVEDELP
jgi:hypothetical protein